MFALRRSVFAVAGAARASIQTRGAAKLTSAQLRKQLETVKATITVRLFIFLFSYSILK
jgi:hypothetical protein